MSRPNQTGPPGFVAEPLIEMCEAQEGSDGIPGGDSSANPALHRTTPSALEAPAAEAGYWTGARLELATWMHRYAPSLAELYRGAVRLVYGPPIPGRVVLIAHAVREICNRLPERVSGTEGEGRLDYPSRLDKLARQWERAGLDLQGAIPAGHAVPPDADLGPSPDVAVPGPIFAFLAELVRHHVRAREKPLKAAKRLFSAAVPEGGSVAAPVIDQWLNIRKWFQARDHDSGRVDADFDEAELRVQFELFERSLLAVARPFYATLDELDAILEHANA
jgi:hypothetical protein